MSYPALPDRRMGYDNDGTVVVTSGQNQPYTSGASSYPSGAQVIALNGLGVLTPSSYAPIGNVGGSDGFGWWWFFPEQREVSAAFVGLLVTANGTPWLSQAVLEGSNDTTNGLDGSWETASTTLFGANQVTTAGSIDAWRSGIKAVSFTGPKQVIRIRGVTSGQVGSSISGTVIHLYGSKASGQTPDDILFLNGNASFAEFISPMDFGDRPLGTTAVWTFKVKNASPTHTANTINIQCNDADFAISSDGVTYGTTINITSLASGASSGTLYCRDTTPNPGAALGPRFARIITTVASYT